MVHGSVVLGSYDLVMIYRSGLDVVGRGVVSIGVVLGAVKDSNLVACIAVNRMIKDLFGPLKK